MNKEEFLRVLREKLSILDEKEMQDILSEYEQHIDMKTAGAMTEEEAIADFGNLDDLASDILEAYHVRADYGKDSRGMEPRAGLWTQLQSGTDRIFCWIKDTSGRFGAWLRGKWRSCSVFWRRFLQKCFQTGKRREKTEIRTDEEQQVCTFGEGGWLPPGEKRENGRMENVITGMETTEADADRKGRAGNRERNNGSPSFLYGMRKGIRSFFSGCAALCRACWRIFVWGMKWAWNLGWIMVGGMIGLTACFCLFLLGVFLVLGSQGYPLTGVTIGTVGVSMCLASLMGLCFTFMVRPADEPRIREAASSHRKKKVRRMKKEYPAQDAGEEEYHA